MFASPCQWCLMTSNPYLEVAFLAFGIACALAIPIVIAKGVKDGLL